MELLSGLCYKQPPTIPSCKPSGEKSTNTKLHAFNYYCSNLLCFFGGQSFSCSAVFDVSGQTAALSYHDSVPYRNNRIFLRIQEQCASRKEAYRWCLTMIWETRNEIEIRCSENPKKDSGLLAIEKNRSRGDWYTLSCRLRGRWSRFFVGCHLVR